MIILFFFLAIMVLCGLILTSLNIHKSAKEHRQIIEHLQRRVVEMNRKQLDLSEKVKLENSFKNINQSNSEKLNKEIFELCNLLIKTAEAQSHQYK